jgi:hypothetical protein
VDEGIRKLVCVHQGVALALERKENLPCVTARINLEDTMLSERSQAQKDKKYVISLTRVDLRVPSWKQAGEPWLPWGSGEGIEDV